MTGSDTNGSHKQDGLPRSCPVKFIAIFFIEKYIHGLSEDGKLFSFYVYSPLINAYAGGYEIPFASNWEKYSRDIALHYLPVPSGIPLVGGGLDGTITSQRRDQGDHPDTIRSWEQAVFQGWPLYFMQENPQVEHVVRPIEFWLAETALGTPAAYYGSDDNGGVTLPGPFIGP